MPKNAYSQSYRKMSELSSPPITLAVLDYTGLQLHVCLQDFPDEHARPMFYSGRFFLEQLSSCVNDSLK
jgi:hypothetical protein